MSNAPRRDPRRVVMAASLAVAFLMLGGKLTAWAITGSSAIFSDASESVVHLVATGIAAFSLWYSGRPADRDYQYGYGKIAYFSAGFEGALILLAGLVIVGVGVRALIIGPELRRLGLGILITAGLGLVNLALGLSLVRVGRKHSSVVLVANGQHVLTDMWTSLGTVLGVTLVWITGWLWVDPVCAILIGLHVLHEAVRLVRASFAGLMDQADEQSTQRIIKCLEQAVEDDVVRGFHQLRHRSVNDQIWIEVHLLVPDTMTAREAHERATRVERELEATFGGVAARVTTHVEPADHAVAHPEGHRSPDPTSP